MIEQVLQVEKKSRVYYRWDSNVDWDRLIFSSPKFYHWKSNEKHASGELEWSAQKLWFFQSRIKESMGMWQGGEWLN